MPSDTRKDLQLRHDRPTGGVSSKRLASMPLSSLLPRLGEVGSIVAFAETFTERAAELQANSFATIPGEDDESEIRKKRMLEESMLNQALQWLSIQGTRD